MGCSTRWTSPADEGSADEGTPTAAPYGCSWNTAGRADGLYDPLRATALDASGYSRTSTVSSRRVDNTTPASAVSAATPLKGIATVSATAGDFHADGMRPGRQASGSR